ncbi:hypothetical protein [Nocardia phage P3.1]|nr:hypothetical protein [Nocardia phage P3.1]
MTAILVAVLCITTSALTALVCRWYWKMVVVETAAIFEEREKSFIDNVMTARERELHDAQRSYMPREDSGPSARVRSAIPKRQIGRR